MILPKKLDELVVSCVKEINRASAAPDDTFDNYTNLYEVIERNLPHVDEKVKSEIINRYINENNLSTLQKKTFRILIGYCL
jgi:hypothetical protein